MVTFHKKRVGALETSRGKHFQEGARGGNEGMGAGGLLLRTNRNHDAHSGGQIHPNMNHFGTFLHSDSTPQHSIYNIHQLQGKLRKMSIFRNKS